MAQNYNKYQTVGSSALKSQDREFDICTKPRFASSATYAQTPIINFKDIRFETARTTDRPMRSKPQFKEKRGGIFKFLMGKLQNDRILSGLFAPKHEDHYSNTDLAFFTKGFTFVGLATFVMILFGA